MNYRRVVFRGMVCDVIGIFNTSIIEGVDDSPVIPCYALERQGDYSEDADGQMIIAPIFECSHLPASIVVENTDWFRGVYLSGGSGR